MGAHRASDGINCGGWCFRENASSVDATPEHPSEIEAVLDIVVNDLIYGELSTAWFKGAVLNRLRTRNGTCDWVSDHNASVVAAAVPPIRCN